MKKLKIACVGAGRLAQSSHLPSLTALDAVELAAISDLDPARLEEAAGRFGIKNRYLDYRGMLEKERPDAVFVIVPPHHVYDIMVFCLQRKLHVFLEKPPGLTSGQTRQLALLAEANHCLTMVGFQRRHIPLLKLVRGRLGDVDQIMVSYYKNTVGQPPYYNGAIDILRCDAIHAVDTLRWLGGEVAALASSVRSLHATYDNSFNALLRFQSGVVGTLSTNWTSGRRFFTVELHAKGRAAFVDPDDRARLYADDKAEPEVITAQAAAGSDEFHRYYGFFDEDRHFVDCLLRGEAPQPGLDDSAKTMELVDQLYNPASQI